MSNNSEYIENNNNSENSENSENADSISVSENSENNDNSEQSEYNEYSDNFEPNYQENETYTSEPVTIVTYDYTPSIENLTSVEIFQCALIIAVGCIIAWVNKK